MKWQYKVLTLNGDAKVDGKALNDLGAAGWELIAVYADEKNRFAYLKIQDGKPKRKVIL